MSFVGFLLFVLGRFFGVVGIEKLEMCDRMVEKAAQRFVSLIESTSIHTHSELLGTKIVQF